MGDSSLSSGERAAFCLASLAASCCRHTNRATNVSRIHSINRQSLINMSVSSNYVCCWLIQKVFQFFDRTNDANGERTQPRLKRRESQSPMYPLAPSSSFLLICKRQGSISLSLFLCDSVWWCWFTTRPGLTKETHV